MLSQQSRRGCPSAFDPATQHRADRARLLSGHPSRQLRDARGEEDLVTSEACLRDHGKGFSSHRAQGLVPKDSKPDSQKEVRS